MKFLCFGVLDMALTLSSVAPSPKNNNVIASSFSH